jgi:hypothetical protein
MRGEIIRLVFSLCLIGGAFLAGMYTGWRKWGHRPDHDRPVARFTTVARPSIDDNAHELRRDLFAPETEVVDLRRLPSALPRRAVVRSDRSLPRATIIADDFVTTRSEHDPRRVD